MITRFRVENYKALRDVSLELTPMHALIGPNDSGKTSILTAICALCRSIELPLARAFVGIWEGRELVWRGASDGVVRLSADMNSDGIDVGYSLACRFPNAERNVVVEDERITHGSPIECQRRNHSATKVFGVCVQNEDAEEAVKQACRLVHGALSRVHYCRWNPRLLALPAAPASSRRFRMNSDGFGLALFLDDILGFDRELFGRLEQRFCSIFPDFASIKLVRQMAFRSPSDDPEQVSQLDRGEGKGLYFNVRGNGQLIPAAQASDGALLVLAFLTELFSPEPPRLLLVEEPENGIHPKRLKDVLEILRELLTAQARTQILLTTHSPYAVDLFSPAEVTLCTKRGDGTVALRRLTDSQAVGEQRSLFTLGEIWTAEGDEALAENHAASSD